ncbi:YcaO-like family protein [Acinetobacter oleivorans]
MKNINSYSTKERIYDIEISIEKAKDFLSEIGACFSIKVMGNYLKTTKCIIYYKDNIFTGLGKGIDQQTVASAIYEAIEHMFSVKSPDDLFLKKLNLEGDDIDLKNCTPNFQDIMNIENKYFSRKTFKSFKNKKSCEFPYFLVNPYYTPENNLEKFSLRNIKKYSTNSGTSSGLSFYDSVLHGLLEIIERDAIGVELIKTIFKKKPDPVREFNLNKLSRNSYELKKLVELETKGKITLFNITTDIGIPVILSSVCVKANGVDYCYFGSGASLFIENAIERALLESVQSFHIYELTDIKPNPKVINFEKYPNYIRCLLDKGLFGYKGGSVIIDEFSEKEYKDSFPSPKEQVKIIINILEKHNINAYWSIIFNKSPIVVSQVIAPRLERFHLVARGVPVAPSYRGKRFFN